LAIAISKLCNCKQTRV